MDALKSAHQALSLNGTDPVALRVQARSQLHSGQLAEAEKTCRLILERDAGDAHALKMIEQIRQHSDKSKQAADKLFGPAAARAVPPKIVPAPSFRPLKGLTSVCGSGASGKPGDAAPRSQEARIACLRDLETLKTAAPTLPDDLTGDPTNL